MLLILCRPRRRLDANPYDIIRTPDLPTNIVDFGGFHSG